VCSEDDKWEEEEETHIHINQWAVLYYRKKEEGRIEWKQIRRTHTQTYSSSHSNSSEKRQYSICMLLFIGIKPK
jgi:hypothetical protein